MHMDRVNARHLGILSGLVGAALVWVSVGSLEIESHDTFAAVAMLTTLCVFAYALHRYGRGASADTAANDRV
jgi:hypothetical protein